MDYIFYNGVVNKYVFYTQTMQNLSKNVAATLTVVAIAAIVVLFASGPLVGSHALAKYKHHSDNHHKHHHHKHHHHHHHHHHKHHHKHHYGH